MAHMGEDFQLCAVALAEPPGGGAGGLGRGSRRNVFCVDCRDRDNALGKGVDVGGEDGPQAATEHFQIC